MVKRIFFKLLLAAIPALLLGAVYVVADPFAVVRTYPDAYHPSGVHLELNEDYVATETYLRTWKTAGYDAYIFGNSRSRFFTPADWQQHVKVHAIYPFGVALESLYGIAGKLRLIDKKGGTINTVLLVLDHDLLSVTQNSEGHLYRKHPAVSGNGFLDFQLASFRDFCNPEAMMLYVQALRKPAVQQEDGLEKAEREIARDRDAFYAPRLKGFYKRPGVQQYVPAMLEKEHRKLLGEIASILQRHNASYKVVLAPLYDQKKLGAADMHVLDSVFGAANIYDFSGINNMTSDVYNYYELVHFRRHIAQAIMDSIYRR